MALALRVGGAPGASGRAALGLSLQGLLASYTQILFGGSTLAGALLVLATAFVPRAGLAGLGAVVVALLAGRGAGLKGEVVHGWLGCNALLVGLGVGASFEPTLSAVMLTVLGALSVVLLAAAVGHLWSVRLDLPLLTLPFTVTLYLLFGAARLMDIPQRPALPDGAIGAWPVLLQDYLRSLGRSSSCRVRMWAWWCAWL